MKEGFDFSKFIDKKDIKSHDEGRTESKLSEILEQDKAEQLMVVKVVDEEYKEDPYATEDKSLRMRIRNENGDIIYDNSLEEYIALNRDMGRHISLDEIKNLYDEN